MDVLVVADGHYMQDSSGNVYAESVYNYDFYKRYLAVFDRVYAVVRLEEVETIPTNAKLCSGPNVEFLKLPPYRGPFQYIQKYFAIKDVAKDYVHQAPCGIFRLPAATANLVCKIFAKTQKPFAVEIVVDPWEKFAPSASPSIAAPVVRRVWTNTVKEMCRKANGVSYVTALYLQKKYPPHRADNKNYFNTNYSSVELPDNLFAEPRQFVKKEKYAIVHASNAFTDNAKGHIPLMKVAKKVLDQGYHIEVIFIGDGPKLNEFKEYAKELGVENSIQFLGRLSDGMAVRKVMRDCDIFVFPTRAEGLPRVLLEAMSEGLPALSCPTCGIPEVLGREYLCDYDDIDAWANGIIRFIKNPELMTQASRANLEVAKKYRSSELNERRKRFYKMLRNLAESCETEN